MKMPIYYVIYYEELIPCYLIKEGYIPCKDYRENPNDDYYCVSSQRDFCVAHISDKSNIFINKKEAIKVLRNKIEARFNERLRYLMKYRTEKLKVLEEL